MSMRITIFILFIFFCLGGIVFFSPPSSAETCDTETQLCIDLKLRLQGITEKPKNTETIDCAITLQGGQPSTPVEDTVSLSVDNTGIWVGKAVFTDVFESGTTSGSDFIVTLKPPKHLKRKICSLNASEIPDPENVCSSGQLSFELGDNTLYLNSKYFMAGDLPISNAEQNGIIDSVDIIYIRNNIQNNTQDVIDIADINLDNVVDSQDYSLAVYTLSEDIKYDEE